MLAPQCCTTDAAAVVSATSPAHGDFTKQFSALPLPFPQFFRLELYCGHWMSYSVSAVNPKFGPVVLNATPANGARPCEKPVISTWPATDCAFTFCVNTLVVITTGRKNSGRLTEVVTRTYTMSGTVPEGTAAAE